MLAVGDELRVDAAHTLTFRGYTWTNCTLVGPVIENGYIVVYKSGNHNVISSPFDVYHTHAGATRHLDDYPLNVSLPCACSPLLVDPCILQPLVVAYVQKMGTVYAYSSDSVIGLGAIIFIVSLAGLVTTIIAACRKSIKPDSTSDVYVIGNNEV